MILTALTCPLAAQEDSARVEIEYPLVPLQAITEALAGIKMTPADISFRTDYVERDSFRIPLIDSLTENPLDIPTLTQITADRFLNEELDLFNYIAIATYYCLSKKATANDSSMHPSHEYFNDCMFAPVSNFNPPDINYPENINDIDIVTLDPLVNQTLEFLEYIEINRFYFIGESVSPTDRVFLQDSFPLLLLEDEENEFRSVEEMDSLQKFAEGLTHRAIAYCERVFLPNAYQTDYQIPHEIGSYINELQINADEIYQHIDSKDWTIEKETKNGRIAIGGWGANTYSGDYYFILDLGGDDSYNLDQHEGSQIIIDLDGDDTYIGREDYCLGSGFFGFGILYDKAGDDLYKAKNFSLGSGLFGVGMLIDEAGQDTYFGDTHVQGAGTFGIGLLIDRGGNDNYNCALYGQAFAGPDGFGALVDYNGNDNYFAGGKYKDFLRYEDHFLSLSQGFAYGFRPRVSGGMAFLIDSCGNDIYTSDIFGQGASYWYGLGALYDISGNDKYLSFQYAQGNGTHLSLGVLMDKSGDDYYYAKGVSQGCGHDLAAGLLIDYAGNDTYQSYDLCQAAGSANGIGIFIDFLGDDTYETQKLHNTQGYGNPRRDYGSIGLFMDLTGQDHYIGNGRNNYYWIIDSKWGIGMDTDFWEVSE